MSLTSSARTISGAAAAGIHRRARWRWFCAGLFPLVMCSQPANTRAAEPPRSLVLLNARIWTGRPAQPWAEGLAISGARIAQVADSASLRKFDDLSRTIDLDGAFVMPGIIDAHAHLLSAALRVYEVDLLEAGSQAELLRRVRSFAAEHPDEPWIRGRGWEYSDFPAGVLPTRQTLDEIVPDRPVLLQAFDGHTAWVNSKALEMAEVTAQSNLTRLGEVVVDPQTGEPTGVLKESAQSLLEEVLPERTTAEQLAALREILPEVARLGITSVHNASGDAAELALYRQLLDEGLLTARMRFYPHVTPGDFEDELREIEQLAADFAHPLLRVVGVKLWLDGVVETHTAALLDPYADQPATRGAPAYTPDQLRQIVQTAERKRLQVMIHAIGDRAVRMALDAAEKAQSPPALRVRVEHIETVAEADLPRWAPLGAVASMQPIHANPTSIAPWELALGEHRASRGFAWKLLADRGARLALGSDWPAGASFDPWRGVHLAVTRQNLDSQPANGWRAEHALSLDAALHGFTSGGAYAAFEEGDLGVLAPQQFADLIVLDRDPFQIPIGELPRVGVLATIVGGRVVFCDDRLEALARVAGE